MPGGARGSPSDKVDIAPTNHHRYHCRWRLSARWRGAHHDTSGPAHREGPATRATTVNGIMVSLKDFGCEVSAHVRMSSTSEGSGVGVARPGYQFGQHYASMVAQLRGQQTADT